MLTTSNLTVTNMAEQRNIQLNACVSYNVHVLVCYTIRILSIDFTVQYVSNNKHFYFIQFSPQTKLWVPAESRYEEKNCLTLEDIEEYSNDVSVQGNYYYRTGTYICYF